jgi:hypothetical protein
MTFDEPMVDDKIVEGYIWKACLMRQRLGLPVTVDAIESICEFSHSLDEEIVERFNCAVAQKTDRTWLDPDELVDDLVDDKRWVGMGFDNILTCQRFAKRRALGKLLHKKVWTDLLRDPLAVEDEPHDGQIGCATFHAIAESLGFEIEDLARVCCPVKVTLRGHVIFDSVIFCEFSFMDGHGEVSFVWDTKIFQDFAEFIYLPCGVDTSDDLLSLSVDGCLTVKHCDDSGEEFPTNYVIEVNFLASLPDEK